jgi:hypothetical protein
MHRLSTTFAMLAVLMSSVAIAQPASAAPPDRVASTVALADWSSEDGYGHLDVYDASVDFYSLTYAYGADEDECADDTVTETFGYGTVDAFTVAKKLASGSVYVSELSTEVYVYSRCSGWETRSYSDETVTLSATWEGSGSLQIFPDRQTYETGGCRISYTDKAIGRAALADVVLSGALVASGASGFLTSSTRAFHTTCSK